MAERLSHDFDERYRLTDKLELMRLEPGDVLLCRPRSRLSEDQISRLYNQLNTMAGENPQIRIVIVPATWDVAVAHPAEVPWDVVDGLNEMLQEL